MGQHRTGRPDGEVYDWYRRGLELLDKGDAAAASVLLGHAHAEEPESKAIREAMARAQFNARRYAESARTFRSLVEDNPSDDYAHFGLGLALSRLGEHSAAAGHLAMATVMRPDTQHYADALASVRATLRENEKSNPESGDD